MSSRAPHGIEKVSSLTSSHLKKSRFDLNNVGVILTLWDIFVGIPASLLITKTNKFIFTWLGYEKLMRCPSGILGNRCLFVGVNIVLVLGWAVQLASERRREVILEEIRGWDERIRWLEGEVERVGRIEAAEVEEQLRSGVVGLVDGQEGVLKENMMDEGRVSGVASGVSVESGAVKRHSHA